MAISRGLGAFVQHQGDVRLLGCGCWHLAALVSGDIDADQRSSTRGQFSGGGIRISVVDDVRDVVDLSIETADQIALSGSLAQRIRARY